MSSDHTRNSFRRERHYSATRMQQGRVFLDADWNEQVDIGAGFRRTTTGDVVGRCGFPQEAPGFGLVPLGGDLLITPGRGYVAGQLVENPEPAPVELVRASGSGAATTWRVASGAPLGVGQPVGKVGAAPADAVVVVDAGVDDDGFQTVRLSGTLGTGRRKDVVAGATVGAQPHLFDVPLPTDSGEYLAYLEVWERPLTALDDPLLREVALGGPDTATRDQRVWQVRLLPAGDAGLPAPASCASLPAGWRPEGDVAPATLAARAEFGSTTDDPCALPASGGYRSLENHLYRVQIHHGGTIGTDVVRWTWSRDNAVHRSRLLEVSADALVVDDPGRDEATRYRSGDWLEVLDEARVLAGRPGFFVKVTEVNGDRLGVSEVRDPDSLDPVVDNGDPDTAVLPARGTLRRWEGGVPVAADPGTWAPLESGVEVRFDRDGFVGTGDYWTIPARTVTADIEWPADPASGAPASQPAEGIARDHSALGIVAFDGSAWSVTSDCRRIFPPLHGLETFHYLGGDGQDATLEAGGSPTQRVGLDSPLRVGVSSGVTPVAGRPVRFAVQETDQAAVLAAGDGADVVAATARELVVRTGPDGAASAGVAVHPGRRFHHVVATLLDTDVLDQASERHLPITFTAEVKQPPSTSTRDPGIHVVAARMTEPVTGRKEIVAHGAIPWEDLAGGITLDLDAPADPRALKGRVVGKLTFDQPHPLGDEAQPLGAFVDGPEWLRQEVEIVGSFATEGDAIVWLPTEEARNWLQRNASAVMERFTPSARPARLVVHGGRIWSAEDQERLLDGDLLVDPTTTTGVRYPSGDGVRGGDLVLPFLLGGQRRRGGGRLVFVPVAGGPALRRVGERTWRSHLPTVLGAGIDRPAIAPEAARLGLELARTRPDPAAAVRALGSLGVRSLFLVAAEEHAAVAKAAARQLQTGPGLGLTIETREERALEAFSREAIEAGTTDLLLLQAELAGSLTADLGARLGPEIAL